MPRTTTRAAAAATVLPEEPMHAPIEASAQLSSIEELSAALEAAERRIQELEAERGDQLSQILWLQKNAPEDNTRRRGVTSGGTPYIQFGAQYGSLNKQTGVRLFGAWKNFVAYGELATAIGEFFDSGSDRLARIGAYERPWHGQAQGPDGPQATRNSEWVVTRFEAIARVDAPPVREPEGPDYGYTDEEVPF